MEPSLNALVPSALPQSSSALKDYARVAAIIDLLARRPARPPSLDDLAGHVGLSVFHFQRLFKRWAGVSPKQFMGYISLARAKVALERSASMLDAALDAGLSGPSRLHDLFLSVEAMTPGAYKAQGADLVIRYGVGATPFGQALILTTDKGICGVDFFTHSAAGALNEARARWPLSRVVRDQAAISAIADRMFGDGRQKSMPLLLRGTNFQVQVWSALLRVPPGTIVSYGGLGRAIGRPEAGRAVGTAVAANTLGYLVPCHRVLRSTGLFKNYRWGAVRRLAMLGWEAARTPG